MEEKFLEDLGETFPRRILSHPLKLLTIRGIVSRHIRMKRMENFSKTIEPQKVNFLYSGMVGIL